MRKGFAKEAGSRGTPLKKPITTAGGDAKVWNYMEHWVPLVKNDGTEVRLWALDMDRITEYLRVDVSKAA